MTRDLSMFVLSRGRRITALMAMACCLVFMAAGSSAAANREAVKKAIAATVAVEWRPERNPDQQARRDKTWVESVELDPKTGLYTRRLASVGTPSSEPTLSSGVAVSADGLVVALGNLQGEGRYTVTLEDGRKLPATVLVDDQRSGLRLLKIDSRDLPYLSLAETRHGVGDPVVAAFCTDRRGRAAAQGMIAASPRPLHGGRLRLDIEVGRMASGGPVVDDEGRLLGTMSGKSAPSPAEELATYAVPADAVKALLKFRQADHTVIVHRGMLGIEINVEAEGGKERLIARPLPESPAAAAGMKDGDELLAVDGGRVSTGGEVVAAVARHAPGEKIGVTVLREGNEEQIEITLAPPPELDAKLNPAADQRPPTEATINLVRPEQLYVFTQEGKTVAVPATKEQLEPFRNAARAIRITAAPGSPPPPANVIRVERSDLEKKLEEVGRNVQSLQQQMAALTEEIKSLRARLAEEKK